MSTASSYLHIPSSPVDLPADNDCHALVEDRASAVQTCTTATSSRGTITAVVASAGMSVFLHVYRRSGNRAIEVLRSTGSVGTTGPLQWQLASVDPERDGNTKIVAVLLNEPGGSVRGYDLIDVPGVVSLHRQLSDGAVALASGGGLSDWTHAAGDVLVSTLRYESGHWRIAAQRSGKLPAKRVDFSSP